MPNAVMRCLVRAARILVASFSVINCASDTCVNCVLQLDAPQCNTDAPKGFANGMGEVVVSMWRDDSVGLMGDVAGSDRNIDWRIA
jgi:hypothetical protein